VQPFDVVVVGAGHAGCEAAAAAARMGACVALVTLDRRMVGEMPCNPAVGGIGKGHLVAEIDAVGGIQGWAADRAGMQFRVLNDSRGPAVWGPRAQCDKGHYRRLLRHLVEGLDGLTLIEGEVVRLGHRKGRVDGVVLGDGARVHGSTVVLTTGTFLGAVLHTGAEQERGGRLGERPSDGLGHELEGMGLRLRRFKTGTPPRLHRDSIDYSRLAVQAGDEHPQPFSWRSRRVSNHCVCWVARTTEEVQGIIADNIHRSPLYGGVIEGVGPRYCPSIEDKVMRFPHHREHTVFVEPEGRDDPSIYVNGLSTSLPRDVQERVVRAVPGLESARFLRYGYAVEYDVVASAQVATDLQSREVGGLFLAGQVLGTSGYEEAAAQGLVAGVNAVALARGTEPWLPRREDSYIGVLVDDLVAKEHREPYRIFTSRAEHRLVLGVHSARERLMALGVRLGLVPERVFHVQQELWQRRNRVVEELAAETLNPDQATRARVASVAGVEINSPTTWAKVLARPEVDLHRACGHFEELASLSARERRVVVGLLRYQGYGARAERERERVRRLREVEIPAAFDPALVPGLSREVVEELRRRRPRTLAEVERLAAMTPAAMAMIAGRLAAAAPPRGGDGGR